jgi:hypothetical protein
MYRIPYLLCTVSIYRNRLVVHKHTNPTKTPIAFRLAVSYLYVLWTPTIPFPLLEYDFRHSLYMYPQHKSSRSDLGLKFCHIGLTTGTSQARAFLSW